MADDWWHDAALMVSDEKSFLKFLEMLSQDAPLATVHSRIADYIEACAAAGLDAMTEGTEKMAHNPWSVCAQIMAAGIYYE